MKATFITCIKLFLPKILSFNNITIVLIKLYDILRDGNFTI